MVPCPTLPLDLADILDVAHWLGMGLGFVYCIRRIGKSASFLINAVAVAMNADTGRRGIGCASTY